MREQTSKVENSFKKTYLFNVLNHFIRIIRKKFGMLKTVKKIGATIFSLPINKQS
jgi:hypothetical protein